MCRDCRSHTAGDQSLPALLPWDGIQELSDLWVVSTAVDCSQVLVLSEDEILLCTCENSMFIRYQVDRSTVQ